MVSFESDYIAGAHPEVLRRLMETNTEPLPGYGSDPYCESAKEKIRKAVGMPEAKIPLTQAAIRMALANKNNAGVVASGKAKSLKQLSPPPHIASECPPDYLYPHDYPHHWVYQEYMPRELENEHLFEDTLPEALQERYDNLNKATNAGRQAKRNQDPDLPF